MYRVSKLENGLIVATAEMAHMTSVSVGVWIGTGSRYEPAPLNGVCHFIEHMLFKGTRNRSAKEISQAVEGIGGHLNAFTSEETTCFHARACHDRVGVLLDVLLDMLLRSKFAPKEIDKEREVIKEEVAMYLDEPQHHVQELLNSTLWPDQPLGRPITGTEKTLNSMRQRELVRYWQNNYVAGTTMVVAAGKLSHREIVETVAQNQKHFKTAPRRQFPPVVERQAQPRLRLFTRKIEQTQVALGIRTCSRHDERRYALRLLNTILGENSSSRLFQIVREEHGLAYSIYSTPSFFADTGDLVVSAGLDTDSLVRALGLILRELRRLREKPPSAIELRRAQDYVAGQIDLSLESTENQMNWLGEQLVGYGSITGPEETKKRLREVTAREIRSVAGDFFRPERLNLALVSPLKSARRLASLLG